MPIQATQMFLGDAQVPFYYLGDTQVSLAAAPAPLYTVRNDEFAQYIKLAMPYSLFTTLGMTNYYDNIAALVSGSGTSLPMVPTGSFVNGIGPRFETTSSVVNSGSYNFSNEGYQSSVYMSGSQNAGIVTGSALSFGTQKFVMETWFNYNETQAGTPPFNILFFGTPDGTQLLLDANRASNTFRINGAGSATAPWNQAKNTWFHIAYVGYGSGNGTAIYFNGNRIGTGTAGNVTDPTNGFWRILGNANGTNNDGAGKLVQDFRLYVGTDKNYTGSLITPPQSIVAKINY